MVGADSAGKFLVVSIAVHLLFGVGATLYVVQHYQTERKLTFKGGVPVPNANKRSLEHQVSVAKKRNSMSAPAQAMRITTSELANFALPEMPAMPAMTMVTPNKMAGLGGIGVGTASAGGTGGGGTGGGGGGGGGGGLTTFGFRNGSAGGLAGRFYDLKQTKDRKPSGVDGKKYGEIVADFVKKDWPESAFNEFYKAPETPLCRAVFDPGHGR